MSNSKDYSSDEDYSSDDSSLVYSSEEEREIEKKKIPAHIRLKKALEAKKGDRVKGIKKEKINYDE